MPWRERRSRNAAYRYKMDQTKREQHQRARKRLVISFFSMVRSTDRSKVVSKQLAKYYMYYEVIAVDLDRHDEPAGGTLLCLLKGCLRPTHDAVRCETRRVVESGVGSWELGVESSSLLPRLLMKCRSFVSSSSLLMKCRFSLLWTVRDFKSFWKRGSFLFLKRSSTASKICSD